MLCVLSKCFNSMYLLRMPSMLICKMLSVWLGGWFVGLVVFVGGGGVGGGGEGGLI